MIDLDKCIRCHSCEIACKQENDLPVGVARIKIWTIGPRRIKGQLHMDFIPTICLQCDDPVCVLVCNANAISKHESGIVTIDREKCVGCMLCVHACPYGLMDFNQESKKAEKCDFCLSRLEYGLDPACVQHCIGGALQLLDIEEAEKIAGERHRAGTTKVWYISSKWKLIL